ncbi:hypothetical protein GCM10022226_11620 [Sphaerisporangium flaviroseum]|uniref:TIGR04222 domain-containing membrane protein n=1 Tax=Sphaerisporangium flaviroseum TaxID=509199 RepID=A0ABP7HGF2_9ACTN
MTDTDLDLYETAYLCGGPRRVAMVALVALCEDGRARIDPARHRISAVRREPADPVEAAALEAIPETGRHLGYTVAVVAGSPAVEAIGESLRARGLVTRRGKAGILRGRSVRRGLIATEDGAGLRDGEGGLRRVAINGTPGIRDVELRTSFSLGEPVSAPARGPASVGALRALPIWSPGASGYDGGGGFSCDGGGGDGGGGAC